MSLSQSWDIVELKDENDRLRREKFRLEMDVWKLKNTIESSRKIAEPIPSPGGDIECGNCTLNLGAWEEVTEWSYCPFCGAYIEWEGARSCS